MFRNKLFIIIFISLLSACNYQESTKEAHQALPFESSDECHICGMIIMRLSGPKGQAFDTRNDRMKKFCSTSELMFWYLQPENKPNVAEIYVHDMALSSWENPDDSYLISAKDAFFVINSKKQAAMGKTLISFSNIVDAELFTKTYAGNIVTFDQITLDLLATQ